MSRSTSTASSRASARRRKTSSWTTSRTRSARRPKDRPIITHCGSGGRGGKAAEHLCDAGFEAYNGGGPGAHRGGARVREMTESGELPPYTPPMP